jgi:hypothetical protein
MLAGCGDRIMSQAAAPAPVTRSAVVLAEPPDVSPRGTWGPLGYCWNAESKSFEFVPSYSLDLSALGVTTMLAASPVSVGGVQYLVFGYLDSSAEFQFARVHDGDADGYPDAATATVFLDTNEEVYLTYIPQTDLTPDTDHEYVPFLDVRCQDIRLGRDSNADGWIDQWIGSPFARSDDYPALLGVRTIARLNQTGNLVIAAAEGNLYRHAIRVLGSSEHMVLSDTDGDNEADQLDSPTLQSARPSFAPVILRDGMSSIYVWAEDGAGNRTAEVWKVDANGDDIALLGSVVVVNDKLPYEVTLATALDEDDRVSIRFTSHVEEAVVMPVLEASATLHEALPKQVDADRPATTLTLHGREIPSTCVTISLYIVLTGESFSLTPAVVSSTQLSVTLPTFTLDQVSNAFLQLLVDGDAVGEPISIQICKPAS